MFPSLSDTYKAVGAFAKEPSTPIKIAGVKSGRLLVKVENVFKTKGLINRVNIDLNSAKRFQSINQGNKVDRVLVGDTTHIGSPLHKLKVIFDQQGEILNKEVFSSIYNKATSSMRKMCVEGVEKMASVLKWKDTSIHLSVIFICYPSRENHYKVVGMPWHEDLSTISMTVLISPYQQGKLSIHGGSLSIGEKPRHYPFDKPTEGTVKTHKYLYNGGFIFDNIESLHRVEDFEFLKPLNHKGGSIERRLFSIFADPVRGLVESYSHSFGDENLA